MVQAPFPVSLGSIASVMSLAATLAFAPLACSADPVVAAALEGGASEGSSALVDPGWPRLFLKDGASVTIYQPQVESWAGFEDIAFVAAIKVKGSSSEKAVFGSLRVRGRTAVDFATRTVVVDQLQVASAFPDVDPARATALSALVLEVLPERESLAVSLERLAPAIRDPGLLQQSIAVPGIVPPILYSEDPAILVIFLGKPKFTAIQGTSLQFATNTNWDVFLDGSTGHYFLLDEDVWLESADLLRGPWAAATKLPADLSRLPVGDDFADVRPHVPGRMLAEGEAVKKVFVATEPTEMIVTAGKPTYAPVEGTSLLVASNSDSALFFEPQSKQHFFLVAGRWFSASSLEGPWSTVSELPAVFSQLPESPEFDEISAAVRGTEESLEAILVASIPRKALVQRSQARLEVKWDGEPQFRTIIGTRVDIGMNTPFAVFRVDDKHYCCDRGIWFTSPEPAGSYVVCDAVPPAIYEIPASHPSHNVVYVKVYDVTPETVEVGYTLGYQGAYVLNGCLVFGAGMVVPAALGFADEDYWTWHIWVPYYSYGCAAWYNPVIGGFYRGCAWYGPYGGIGYGAIYSPWSGGWARGATVYGPAGYAGGFAAYNPVTDRGIVHAEGGGIYGSWGRTVVTTDDGWISAGRRGGPARGVGWVETSEGGVAVGTRNRGERSFIAKDDDGDIYVGHDGEVYRRDEEGNWSKRDGDDWDRVDPPSIDKPGDDPRAGDGKLAEGGKKGDAPARPTTLEESKKLAETRERLERDRRDRIATNERTQAFERTKRSGIFGNGAPKESAGRAPTPNRSNPSPPPNGGRLGGRVSGGRIGAGIGGGGRRR